jgi:hypothetical protein
MAKDGSLLLSLLEDLRLALAEADLALQATDAPEEERIAGLLALKAIYDFLKSAGLRSRALNNLSMSLRDIDRGHSPTLFAPFVQNRPKDKAKLFILKASAAAAMQLHIDSGKNKAEAAGLVATKLDSAGFRLPGRDPKPASASRVAAWRDRVSGHSDAEGADIYEYVLQEARAEYTTPAQQAECVTRGLKGLVRNLE